MVSSGRTLFLVMRLARFKFLILGFTLYLLGASLAWSNGQSFDGERFLWGFVIFGLAQLSVSFSNDYFDREGDIHGDPSPTSGGSGVLVQYPELAPLAIRIAIVLLLLSAISAVLFTWYYSAGIDYLAFAIIGAWLGFFYSAPPFRLAWNGLGEVTTAIAAGLIMPGMGYFTVTGKLDAWFLLLSVPLMIFGFFFIITVEIPDLEADRKAGKKNIVSSWGLRSSAVLCAIASIAGSLSLVLIWLAGWLDGKVDVPLLAMLSLIPLLVAVLGMRSLLRGHMDPLRLALLNFVSIMLFMGLADLGLLLGIQ